MENFKRSILMIPLLLLGCIAALAQSRPARCTVSGHITDAATGETLIGAGIGAGAVGAVTNTYGFYTLTLPTGKTTLHYSYVGYADFDLEIDLVRDTTLDIALKTDLRIEEAVVSARRESGIAATKMSAVEIPMAAIRNTPVLLGEADVLKTIQLMPGVQGGNEGFSGIYVRGGGPDENLLLLDGISLYNAEHMLGLFSIFQPEAVKKVTLFKGSFPARYGGRTSSIIDVRTNDGNMQETHGSVGVGVISDKFHLEGPIRKGTTAYSVSVRGMHTFLFDRLIASLGSPANYYFYDASAKVTHRLSERDKLFFNVYNGRDILYVDDSSDSEYNSYDDKTRIRWGNTLSALRWNHVFNGKLFSNSTLAWTRYKMLMGYTAEDSNRYSGTETINRYDFNYNSGLRDLTAKIDFDYTPAPEHAVRFGAEYIHHTYVPETFSSFEQETKNGSVVVDTTYRTDNSKRSGHEFSMYVEDDFTFGPRLTLNPGVHLSVFVTSGKTYFAPEPRMSAKYDLGQGFAVKAAWSRMSQYVHLLSSSRITLPLDLWVPITEKIRPVRSDQLSVGVYYNGLRGWEFSLEAYDKRMDNILEYKDGVSFIGNSQSWEENVVMGEGRARGVELFIQKTMGKTTGWLGYTLAKSERRFPDGSINSGEWFPYRYDRRHNISLVVNQQIGKRLDLGATWTFATGGATTLPERQVAFQNPDGAFIQVDYCPYRNNYRLPPSHLLNVSLNYHVRKRRGESIWNFGVYNAYNRMNPNFVFQNETWNFTEDSSIRIKGEKLKSITILPIIPSIGYTYQF